MIKKRYLVGILLGAFVITLTFLAQSPNEDLVWSRQLTSELSPSRIDRNIRSITRWPEWFHSLDQVSILNPRQLTPEEIFPGAQLLLTIEPKKGVKKPFELTVEIKEYEPGNILKLTILKDSSHKLSRIFDELDWTIQLSPTALKNTPEGSTLTGSVHGHTCHWRSRLFGKIAKKILMYQVFYPDLMKLSQLRQPFSMELRIKPAGMMD